MSKMNRLINGVTTFPAVGYPLLQKVGNMTSREFWYGHVWDSLTEGRYLQPRQSVQEANNDAAAEVARAKKGQVRK